ncbi:hypothetical protein, partial [Paenibacillus cookii]|uniref:hypothetical protein n=1 Tax=Paenibacillus cookii TaxID=157839 RepID=UPI001BB3E73F
SILEVFGFGHLKTSPSWGEVPFLCPKILTAQGLRLLQNAHLNSNVNPVVKLYFVFRCIMVNRITGKSELPKVTSCEKCSSVH